MVHFSSNVFFVAFFLYCFAFLFFVIAIAGKRWGNNRDPEAHEKKWGRISFIVSCAALLGHLLFFFTRWIGSKQIPTSNMYEFMTFLAMAIMIAFTIVYAIYRKNLLGMFTLPLVVIIIAYASVFPSDVQPLIPALQSNWLKVHVTTAALGEAFFAVGFAAGMVYLTRVVDFKGTDKKAKREQFWLEFCYYSIILVVGFILAVFVFKGAGYEAQFVQEKVKIDSQGVEQSANETVDYTLPPIAKPYNSQAVKVDAFLGMKDGLFEAPSWMNGVNAGRKLNTVIWSLITGTLLYGLLRLLFRKRLSAVVHPLTEGIDAEDLDEISYRAIAIGFPVFTLGALIFAMIWANKAWGRFWGWDPKEVWALITWLYYSAYLHFRLSRGWHGKKSAWLAVIGFVIVLFTLVGVNLVIAGLHSYAGV
ncbi:c-type cytochrome biogenesis protein CcsB [Paenibacillus protaetiae]|uniref:C-type cytochrome biogenesis protein CcsB n=1 Tax=Paenibacillus protaetiae TaxID=2509456 RepID=A0A4P6EZP6_9BACL|nr:c-type cytochrome biogenesis protein CcsB [Paenibacillus protaetiae]QAY66197.1 c-type cytochrome biogenesis protein CcsB [Paenibacillus protaetiae]